MMFTRIAATLALALGIVAAGTASVPPPAEYAVAGITAPGCLMCPDPGFNPN